MTSAIETKATTTTTLNKLSKKDEYYFIEYKLAKSVAAQYIKLIHKYTNHHRHFSISGQFKGDDTKWRTCFLTHHEKDLKEGHNRDSIDKKFTCSRKDLACLNLYGLHDYSMFPSVICPDIEEIANLIATELPVEKLPTIERLYVTITTGLKDAAYDCETDRHRLTTTVYIVPKQ
jgi:hypothetical protein